MEIRKTGLEDLDAAMAIYAAARAFMADSGNPHQWTNGYPSRETVLGDIETGKSHVCVEGDEILGVFYFAQEDEPVYHRILEGAWLDDRPYGVVHRIAVAGPGKGIVSFCLGWCLDRCGSLRIDTHRDNAPMRKALLKNGFHYCGLVYYGETEERLAFQRLRP